MGPEWGQCPQITSFCKGFLRDNATLDLAILVRVQASQPNFLHFRSGIHLCLFLRSALDVLFCAMISSRQCFQ
jgi:hypothetical protein